MDASSNPSSSRPASGQQEHAQGPSPSIHSKQSSTGASSTTHKTRFNDLPSLSTLFPKFRRKSQGAQQREQHQQQQAELAKQRQAALLHQQRLEQKRTVGDDWIFVSTLGTGTFGRVFLVRPKIQEANQPAFYAMKVLQKSEAVRLRQVEHINNEREILSVVRHPFIVSMRASFQTPTNLFMCLEYAVGGELFSHLRKAVRFQNDVTRFYAAEILLAIEHLHDLNIIYRDLKPENILLDASGHIKMTDFGFAKQIVDRTWTLCGTPEYLAPELIQSKGHGKPVDWWALGVLIFEMLCGYPPFYDKSHIGIYEKILAAKIKFPGHVQADAADLVARLLTPDITRRLGNLSRGTEDVKLHPWFLHCEWHRLLAKDCPVPFVPAVKFAGDTHHFESYQEPKRVEMEMLLSERQGDDYGSPYKQEFADW